MNPAFADAGQVKGLEVWRIEVCLIIALRIEYYGIYCYINSIYQKINRLLC